MAESRLAPRPDVQEKVETGLDPDAYLPCEVFAPHPEPAEWRTLWDCKPGPHRVLICERHHRYVVENDRRPDVNWTCGACRCRTKLLRMEKL